MEETDLTLDDVRHVRAAEAAMEYMVIAAYLGKTELGRSMLEAAAREMLRVGDHDDWENWFARRVDIIVLEPD